VSIPNPPTPLGQASPEENALRHPIQAGEDGNSGSGKTAHGLKDGVEITNFKRDQERERADNGVSDPSQAADQQSLDLLSSRRGRYLREMAPSSIESVPGPAKAARVRRLLLYSP